MGRVMCKQLEQNLSGLILLRGRVSPVTRDHPPDITLRYRLSIILNIYFERKIIKWSNLPFLLLLVSHVIDEMKLVWFEKDAIETAPDIVLPQFDLYNYNIVNCTSSYISGKILNSSEKGLLSKITFATSQ